MLISFVLFIISAIWLWRGLSHIFAAGDMASDSIVARLAPDAARSMLSGCSLEFIDGEAGVINEKWIEGLILALDQCTIVQC